MREYAGEIPPPMADEEAPKRSGSSFRPDYKIRVTPKSDKKNYSVVGAAWLTETGMISVKLNPGTVLDWRMNAEYFISLVPNESK